MAEQLKVGDQVWGYDLDAQKKVLVKVTAIRAAHADQIIVINDSLRVTAEHPIYADGKWVRAGELDTKHTLISSAGKAVELTKLIRLRQRVRIFDITVQSPHTFFAGGVLVHNKTQE